MVRLFLLIWLLPFAVLAHGGGFDDYGCHTNRSTQDYHCHHSEAVANFYRQKIAGEALWYRAHVLGITDGDSLRVQARIWLGHQVETAVRINGIDTPELGRRAKCPSENKKAKQARDYLADLAGQEIILHRVEYDKYGGRVLADVYTADFKNIGLLMINNHHARFYDGSTPRRGWCKTK